MDDVPPPPPPPTSQNRCRNNSVSVIPINLTIIHHQSSSSATTATTTSSSSSSSSGDFDQPISYISLKDLLPSTPVNSPKSNSPVQMGSEISIKNRLVKQAAWAYLQPMSTCPDSSNRNFLHNLWNKLRELKNPIAAFREFFHLHILRRLNNAFDCLLRAIRIRSYM